MTKTLTVTQQATKMTPIGITIELQGLYMRKTYSSKSWSQNVKRVSQTVWEIQSGFLFAVNSLHFFALHEFV